MTGESIQASTDETPARKPPRVMLAAFPERYVLPGRPSGGSAAVLDAYRQTGFLIGNDLALFEGAMNLQLQIVAANAKAKSVAAGALFGMWSRVFSHTGDACSVMTNGSYSSCAPLLRAALDCLAAQRSFIDDKFEHYEEWYRDAVSQDRAGKALAIDAGHFRATSVLMEDEALGTLFRLLSDLTMPHVGSTLFMAAPELSLQKAPLAFAEAGFHLGWAELITGWLLLFAGLQIEIAASSGVFTLSKALALDADGMIRDISVALASKRRCYVENLGGRFLFHNFRRTASGQPKRVILG